MAVRPLGKTILLVEDEPLFRRLVVRALEEQGYQLLEACNGDEAVRLAADYPGTIDLLLTDIVMPRMDGFTLGERFVESHPETRVLFMSGHADRSATVHDGLQEAKQPYLLKPFRLNCLLQAIHDHLARSKVAGRPRE